MKSVAIRLGQDLPAHVRFLWDPAYHDFLKCLNMLFEANYLEVCKHFGQGKGKWGAELRREAEKICNVTPQQRRDWFLPRLPSKTRFTPHGADIMDARRMSELSGTIIVPAYDIDQGFKANLTVIDEAMRQTPIAYEEGMQQVARDYFVSYQTISDKESADSLSAYEHYAGQVPFIPHWSIFGRSRGYNTIAQWLSNGDTYGSVSQAKLNPAIEYQHWVMRLHDLVHATQPAKIIETLGSEAQADILAADKITEISRSKETAELLLAHRVLTGIWKKKPEHIPSIDGRFITSLALNAAMTGQDIKITNDQAISADKQIKQLLGVPTSKAQAPIVRYWEILQKVVDIAPNGFSCDAVNQISPEGKTLFALTAWACMRFHQHDGDALRRASDIPKLSPKLAADIQKYSGQRMLIPV